MKKIAALVFVFSLLAVIGVNAQSKFKEHKAGHVFYVSLPEYVTKTMGLNDAASIQFKNEEKNVYGIIIVDDKDEMKDFDYSFASLKEYYNEFTSVFLKDYEKRKIGAASTKTIGKVNFMECDASYYDKEVGGELSYLVGCVETPTAFYKVLCWTLMSSKSTYKADFQKILYSLHD